MTEPDSIPRSWSTLLVARRSVVVADNRGNTGKSEIFSVFAKMHLPHPFGRPTTCVSTLRLVLERCSTISHASVQYDGDEQVHP